MAKANARRYRAAYEKCTDSVENDLVEGGHGISILWYEVFVFDEIGGARILGKSFQAVTEEERDMLLRKAEGIAATMNDEEMLQAGIESPIVPDGNASAISFEAVELEGDDDGEIAF